jgi:hypothetical protein
MRVSRAAGELSDGGYVFQSVSFDGARSFVAFESFEEFRTWYLCVEPGSRRVFEMIRDGPQKPKFDIDGNGATRSEALACVETICQRVRSEVPSSRCLVYEIVGGKPSFHVVVDKIAVPSAASAKFFAEIFSVGYESLVDAKVYNRVQFFRCEGSTKHGERRFKKPFGCEDLFAFGLKNGLVSYVEDCRAYGSEIGPRVDERVALDERVPSTCSNFVRENFKVRKAFRNGVISLTKIKPYRCPCCLRVHHSENPYLVRRAGGFSFVCRRSNESVFVRSERF